MFISGDKVHVAGLVSAGPTDFKTDVSQRALSGALPHLSSLSGVHLYLSLLNSKGPH